MILGSLILVNSETANVHQVKLSLTMLLRSSKPLLHLLLRNLSVYQLNLSIFASLLWASVSFMYFDIINIYIYLKYHSVNYTFFIIMWQHSSWSKHYFLSSSLSYLKVVFATPAFFWYILIFFHPLNQFTSSFRLVNTWLCFRNAISQESS